MCRIVPSLARTPTMVVDDMLGCLGRVGLRQTVGPYQPNGREHGDLRRQISPLGPAQVPLESLMH